MRRAKIVAMVLVTTGLWMSSAVAQDEPELKPWSTEIGLGFMRTSGNTDTNSVNGTANVVNQRDLWRHTGRAEVFRSSTDGVETAERYLASLKSDYKLDDSGNYLFALLGYEDDRFSGYDYQATASVGYGRSVLRGPAVTLDLEAGVGARFNELTDSGESESEGLVRLAGVLEWAISENATFGQELNTEIGEDLTITNSLTSLSTRIVGNLAAKLTFRVRHISEVPPGVEKRDTETAANLVYTF